MSFSNREIGMKRNELFWVEVLESRTLLAGNVTATVVKGDLIVQGDGARNRIVISDFRLESGGVRVAPADDVTTINGNFDATLTGVTGSIIIRCGGGADTIDLRDLSVDDDL